MNWGKSITLIMVLFMLFIGSMVYHAFTKNADLVQEDYYESELNYDHNKQSELNYAELDNAVIIDQREEGIVFQFPVLDAQMKEGSIYFYRPDEKKLDRKFKLEIGSNNTQTLAYDNFKEGYYDIRVEWNAGEKSYLFEDHIQF